MSDTLMFHTVTQMGEYSVEVEYEYTEDHYGIDIDWNIIGETGDVVSHFLDKYYDDIQQAVEDRIRDDNPKD